MTNIWTSNGNRVAALVPGPDDLFVVTTLFGKQIAVQPITEYAKALSTAQTFATQTKHTRPFTVKVLCMSFPELLAFQGTTREECAKALKPEDRHADWNANVAACMNVLRTSNEPQVRADAIAILTSMGVMQG